MWDGKAALPGLLFKHLLFVLESEELLAVLEERLQEVFILGIVHEDVELGGDVPLFILRLLPQLPCDHLCTDIDVNDNMLQKFESGWQLPLVVQDSYLQMDSFRLNVVWNFFVASF